MISIHALLAESDFSHRESGQNYINFNPRSPCGERQRRPLLIRIQRDFNPRSPCGERPSAPQNILLTGKFQSTLSLRRATRERSHRGRTSEFQSTLSLRRATLRGHLPAKWHQISIHALLAESDAVPPLEVTGKLQFQSTLSLRRATQTHRNWASGSCYFNPRSPCGERRCPGAVALRCTCDFNPRSPCGERRPTTPWFHCGASNFNPRSPCGERPGLAFHAAQLAQISIHALLAESDDCRADKRVFHLISIHALLAESDARSEMKPLWDCTFQSTLSLRRATDFPAVFQTLAKISIHALLAESDQTNRDVHCFLQDFNPRSPCGERLCTLWARKNT